MENRINQIIEFDADLKYFVLKQAIYNNENYFLVVRVTNDEEDVIPEEQLILHETIVDGESIVKIETDEDTLKLLAKYLFPKEA